MDEIMGLKNIELSLNMTQVLETLISITSGMRDKEKLHSLIKILSQRELEVYRIEAELREKLMSVIAQYNEKRVQDYKSCLKKKKLFSFMRGLEIEKEAVELANQDTKRLAEVLAGQGKIELLEGGKRALQQATQEFLNLLRPGQCNFDIDQLTKSFKNAIR